MSNTNGNTDDGGVYQSEKIFADRNGSASSRCDCLDCDIGECSCVTGLSGRCLCCAPDNFWSLLGDLVSMGGWLLILVIIIPMILGWLLPGPLEKAKKKRR